MALAQTVSDSLNEAQTHLRNALAFAARGERPLVCKQIAGMIHQCEMISGIDDVLDSLDDVRRNLDNN